jgi:uncharacterized protein YkwD
MPLTNLPAIRRCSKTALAAAVLATAVLFAGSRPSALACPYTGLSPSSLTTAQAELSVICLVNKKRHRRGAARLAWNPRLQGTAESHSTAMDSYNFFAHGGGGTLVDRVRASGYLAGASSWIVGEDLGWGSDGQGTPKATVNRWMASPSHRATMLSPGFRNIGVGVTVGSPIGGNSVNAAIYTADFGRRH